MGRGDSGSLRRQFGEFWKCAMYTDFQRNLSCTDHLFYIPKFIFNYFTFSGFSFQYVLFPGGSRVQVLKCAEKKKSG